MPYIFNKTQILLSNSSLSIQFGSTMIYMYIYFSFGNPFFDIMFCLFHFSYVATIQWTSRKHMLFQPL